MIHKIFISNYKNCYELLCLLVITDLRTELPRTLMSEFDRPVLELSLSFGTQDIFIFAVFHTFDIVIEFSILLCFDETPGVIPLE